MRNQDKWNRFGNCTFQRLDRPALIALSVALCLAADGSEEEWN